MVRRRAGLDHALNMNIGTAASRRAGSMQVLSDIPTPSADIHALYSAGTACLAASANSSRIWPIGWPSASSRSSPRDETSYPALMW